MKTDMKLALVLLANAQKAINDSFQDEIDAVTSAGTISPYSNLQAGMCEIQDKMNDMFVELEAKIKELDNVS